MSFYVWEGIVALIISTVITRGRIAFSVIAMTVVYFSINGLGGESGLYVLKGVHSEISRLEAELDSLLSIQDIMLEKTAGMQEDSLDIDLLDERIRYTLGYAVVHEKILVMQDS